MSKRSGNYAASRGTGNNVAKWTIFVTIAVLVQIEVASGVMYVLDALVRLVSDLGRDWYPIGAVINMIQAVAVLVLIWLAENRVLRAVRSRSGWLPMLRHLLIAWLVAVLSVIIGGFPYFL